MSYEECPACGDGRREDCPVCGGPPSSNQQVLEGIAARLQSERDKEARATVTQGGLDMLGAAKALAHEAADRGSRTAREADILSRALAQWGLPSQLAMLAEESAELAAASMHMLRERHDGDNEAAWIREMADVSIMLDQMRIAGFAPRIAAARAMKMERLARRLEEAAGG